MLIPLANVLLLYFLAFADWPVKKSETTEYTEHTEKR
jgi:hypothetical protein